MDRNFDRQRSLNAAPDKSEMDSVFELYAPAHETANRMQVLVIGAGVVGLAVARAAARRGHDVMVAEAESAIGTGTQCLTSFCAATISNNGA